MHYCEAVLIACEDFRLHQRKNGQNCVAEFIKKLGFDCDLITRAGGVQDLVQPKNGFDNSMLRDVEVSVKLHKADKIFLINHEDCGAYSSFGFTSKEAEFDQHKKDLIKARQIIYKNFPGKETKIYFVLLRKDKFEIKEL